MNQMQEAGGCPVEYATVPGTPPDDRAAVLFGQEAVQYARASGVQLRHPDLVTRGALERLKDDADCMRSRLDWEERMRAVERLGELWCELGPGDVQSLGDLARADRDAQRVDGSDRYLVWGDSADQVRLLLRWAREDARGDVAALLARVPLVAAARVYRAARAAGAVMTTQDGHRTTVAIRADLAAQAGLDCGLPNVVVAVDWASAREALAGHCPDASLEDGVRWSVITIGFGPRGGGGSEDGTLGLRRAHAYPYDGLDYDRRYRDLPRSWVWLDGPGGPVPGVERVVREMILRSERPEGIGDWSPCLNRD